MEAGKNERWEGGGGVIRKEQDRKEEELSRLRSLKRTINWLRFIQLDK